MAATLDSSISVLFVLDEQELAREAQVQRHGLQSTDEGYRLLVSVRFDKNQLQAFDQMPNQDLAAQIACPSLQITNVFNNVFTGSVLLGDVMGLCQQPGLVYVSALPRGQQRMHRSRIDIGANVVDGQSIRNGAARWNGQGIVVGVIDSGLDLRHPAFREFPGGPTRVAHYWDRTVAVRPGSGDVAEPGTGQGVVYTRAQINDFLLGPAVNPPVIAPETEDFNGHGSHVTGIAASGAADFKGVAPGASIIMVRYLNTDLLALDVLVNWIFTQAGGPCAINVSLGTNAGPHDGTDNGEVGLDATLRDPVSLSPRQGRFIAIAAGNERQKRWSINSFVLPLGRPATQVLWHSPISNDNLDTLEFWYSGKDQIAVRVLAPFAAGDRTSHWVDPDPAGCVERPSPGGFAPVVAGPAGTKRFNFDGGVVINISQVHIPNNNDRRITVEINPPANGIIRGGNWIIEFEGRNRLPGGGRLYGIVRDNTAVETNSRFEPARHTARRLHVPVAGELTIPLAVGFGNDPLDINLFVEYPSSFALEASITPPRDNPSNPSQWVAHNNVSAALAGTTAPGAAGPQGLPFSFVSGLTQVAAINHTTVAGVKRISVQIQQRLDPPNPNQPVEEGVYTLRLRAVSAPVPVPAVLLSQMHQQLADTFRFDSDFNTQVSLAAYPSPCLPAVTRLEVRENGAPFQTRVHITMAGGTGVDVRVRIPPRFSSDSSGWSFTPWIGANNAERATPGALVVQGAPAAGAARTYAINGLEVSLNYANPAAGADVLVDVQMSGTVSAINAGQWLIEYRGNGITVARNITAQLIRETINTDSDEREVQLSPDLDFSQHYLSGRVGQQLALAFSVPGSTLGQIDLELLYDQHTELCLSLKAPGEPLPYWVGLNNSVVNGTGLAPSVSANGVSGSLANGTRIVIATPSTAAFGTQRRATLSIQTPAPRALFHPAGEWVLLVKTVSVGAQRQIVARLAAEAAPAQWILCPTELFEDEQASLSVPATAREVMAVASTFPGFAPSSLPAFSSSAGPVRTASEMQVNGNQRQWIPYQKPEIAAPGHGIMSVCAGANSLWFGPNIGWNSYQIRGGHTLGMRATWPFLNNGLRIHSQNITPSAAAGNVTEVHFDVIIPEGARHQASFELRYPSARNFAVRVSQPAAAPAPNLTSAVSNIGALVAIPAAAAAVVMPPHPDGAGQSFVTDDVTQITIRQNGLGTAKIHWHRSEGNLQVGTWRITVRHTEVFPAPVVAVLEAFPELDEEAWPSLTGAFIVNPTAEYSVSAPPRIVSTIGPAVPANNPFSLNYFLHVNRNCVTDVSVRFSYPLGAHSFELLVLSPNDAQHTDGITTAGGVNAIAGARPVNGVVPNGARFRFTAGDTADNLVTITQNGGNASVTISRGTSAQNRIGPGIWNIRFLNRSTTQPPAPIEVTANLDPGPHDAPYFALPTGRLPFAFRRCENLVAATVVDWNFRVPPGRHRNLVLDLIYDARDTLVLQVNSVTGQRTDPVVINNALAAALDGATLHADAAPAAPNPRVFTLADQFIVEVDHRVSPQSALRNRVRITLKQNGLAPIPEGMWQLRINPVALGAGSNGMAEAFLDEMLYRAYSGTSMATPHITGLAALMLQQDANQTHLDLKRRMFETAKPAVLGYSNHTTLSNSWHPVVGWGLVDASAALLRHPGGLAQNVGGAPAAVAKVTGCPVNCEDNCLIEPVMAAGQLQNLIVSDRAPYSSAPDSAAGDAYEFCSRLSNYTTRFRANAFTGGQTANLANLSSTAIAQPLKRDRNLRGTLNGFEPISWEDAYTELAERFVEQWSSTGTVLVVEPMANTGLVKELLFNRFIHHLQALLTANNQVTKCSFTTKKSVQVVGARSPFGQLNSGATHTALQAFLNGQTNRLLSRCEMSLAHSLVVWGANLPANARGFWRSVLANQAVSVKPVAIFVIDPGLRDLPDSVRKIAIAPGTDRYLAQALVLRIVGNTGHADANRQIPPLSMFGDANFGEQRFLSQQASDFDDFVTHIRDVAQNYLSVAVGVVSPDAGLTNLILPGADAARLTLFGLEFNALVDAFAQGPVATVLGSGVSRYVQGEEHVQYIAALGFLSSSLGMPGAGLALGEDMHLQFNSTAFASTHQTLRPEDNPSLGQPDAQQALNLASMAADSPDNTKVCVWFDMDPLAHLPDSHKMRDLLGSGGTQLNIQIAHTLDDASPYADIILPLADSLQSWDLFMGGRSPYINLGQGVEAYDPSKTRPWARVLHEVLQCIYVKLNDRFHDDLVPVIDDNIYKTGPLLLPKTRRDELMALMSDGQQLTNLLVDQLPRPEVVQMYQQINTWYTGIHGNQPTVDTDEAIDASNWVQFFNRLQVDWILEALLTAYPQREAIVVLYQLLSQGYAKAPLQFSRDNFVITPDGTTPFCTPVAQGTVFVALQGNNGFVATNTRYAAHFAGLDNSVSAGKPAFPMTLVVAQSRDYVSHKIPLDTQVATGTVVRPQVWLNPNSASLSGKNINDGDVASLSGNLSYVADQRFEKLIAEVTVKFDPTMALETLWMLPGWEAFNRNGLRTVRGVHTEEGETPAIYDNLVKIENSGYIPPAGAQTRGASPAKR